MKQLFPMSVLYASIPYVFGKISIRQAGADASRPIEYVGSDGDGHVKGDVHIQLSNEAATSANNFFGNRDGTCQAKNRKRVPDAGVVDCLWEDLTSSIFGLGEGRELNQLVPQFPAVPADLPLPNFVDENVAAAYGRFIPYAADHLPQYTPGLAQQLLIPAATLLFFIVTSETLKGVQFVGEDLYLSAKDLFSSDTFALSCPDLNGPFAPACSRFYCQGENEVCTNPIMKPCGCVPTECPYPQDMYTCTNPECNGKNNYCTADGKKNCECIAESWFSFEKVDPAWIELQVAILRDTPVYVPPPKESVITDGSNFGTCGNGKTIGNVGTNSKPIDKNAMQRCLKTLDTTKWLDGQIGQASDCDHMVTFESASTSWNSPADCYDACKNCLSAAIEEGVNQIWCDAYYRAAHCWMGFTIPNPPPLTDGSSWKKSQQRIDHKDGFIDKFAAQACLRTLPTDRWITGDAEVSCPGVPIKFGAGSSAWDSMGDCYNAIKNCVSDAINQGATEAWCDAYAGVAAHCWLGFHKV